MPFSQIAKAQLGFLGAWRLMTFGLILLGSMALAFTGEIHPLVVTFFVVAWGAGLLRSRPPHWWKAWMTHLLTWAFLLLIAIVSFFSGFTGVLYLLLFLGLFKCFTLREPLDHLHALILSFLMLLACSVITTSMIFLPVLLLYLMAVMVELICLTMVREAVRTRHDQDHIMRSVWEMPVFQGLYHKRFFIRLAFSVAGIGLFVMALAFFFFLIIPHSQPQISPWAQPFASKAKKSGYADNVTLGALDRIELDDTPVFWVKAYWEDGVDRSIATGLRLRGTVLDYYDFNKGLWQRHPKARLRNSPYWEKVSFGPLSWRGGPVLVQEIRQSISQTPRLFAAISVLDVTFTHLGQSNESPETRKTRRRDARSPNAQGDVKGGYALNMDYDAKALQLIDWPNGKGNAMGSDAVEYIVRSTYQPEAMQLLEQLASRNKNLSASDVSPEGNFFVPVAGHPEQLDTEDQIINTQMPDNDFTDRMSDLSRRIAWEPYSPAKVLQLVEWFHRDFEYSLEPQTGESVHPIETFLLHTRKGHCEYFATSLVMLLRTQGIPARLVSGFYTPDWQGQRHTIVVRQSDAHAWAEVWLQGYGWLTVDPTPPAWRGRDSFRKTVNPAFWGRVRDDIRSLWQRYILDYSAEQQRHLIHLGLSLGPVREAVRLAQALRDNLRHIDLGIKLRSDGHWRLEELIRVTYVLLGLVALLGMYAFYRKMRTMKAEVLAQPSPVIFMNELIERLYLAGYRRRICQTPAELIGEVDRQTQGCWDLATILDLYHRSRFGGYEPSAGDMARVNQVLRQIRKLETA